MKRTFQYLFCLVLVLQFSCNTESIDIKTEVCVIGDGTGAVAAAIQSARSGAETILITSIPWLGGMLTSAGVSATDGNHQLHTGLWNEFRNELREHYGGADSLFTGWVSNTMFEPHVGDQIWKGLAQNEQKLTIYFECQWKDVQQASGWKVVAQTIDQQTINIKANILIDGTDLGDVGAHTGYSFDVGMDSKRESGEEMAPGEKNNIIQDLTYAAILKNYPEGDYRLMEKPEGYNPELFYCSCQSEHCPDTTVHPCDNMLSYGLLPNSKYMINWPLKGNDYYFNPIGASEDERREGYDRAKLKTLQFVYYIQHELGYQHLGLADDEFPTDDLLPFMPYHREGRRFHGLARMNVNHILDPYRFNLYKTGIAVGDYPIDHHHYENESAPEIDFPPVPSFNIPIGSLIPAGSKDFLIADKPISVSNIVNGSSRLQPVIIQIGQTAGAIAAYCIRENVSPDEISIRQVQSQLIKNGQYLLPYIDVGPDHPQFESIQRIGATGILRGEGIPYKWANQTWFYPDQFVSVTDLIKYLREFDSAIDFNEQQYGDTLTIEKAFAIIERFTTRLGQGNNEDKLQDLETAKGLWNEWDLNDFEWTRKITRAELAKILDKSLNPFEMKEVDFQGNWKGTN